MLKSSMPTVRWGLAALLVTALTGCGGGGGSTTVATPANPGAVNGQIAAADVASLDASTAFTTLPSGVTAVTIASPPVVSFVVKDANGNLVTGLTKASMRFAVAQLIRGTAADYFTPGTGSADQWSSYLYTPAIPGVTKFGATLSTNVGSGPSGTAKLASAWQATTESPVKDDISNPADCATTAGCLHYDATKGYYTYRFVTDIKAGPAALPAPPTSIPATLPVAAGWDATNSPTRVHRVAIQISFAGTGGATVVANPYFDFTLDASGKSMAATGNATRTMVDVASCNQCHDKLAVHGGGRVEPQFCVMCHNPGTTDPNSGNVLDFKVMIHKIHRGKALANDYLIWGFNDVPFIARQKNTTTGVTDGVGYPQDLRNCVKCHDGANAKTPQGGNWETKPTRDACFACHDDSTAFVQAAKDAHNSTVANGLFPDDSQCSACHGPNQQNTSVAAKHNVQEWILGKNYQYNLHKVTVNADRTVTAEFSVSNPVDGSVYNILDPQYKYDTISTDGKTVTHNFVFGRLNLLFGWDTRDYGNAKALGRAYGSSCTTTVATSATTCDANGNPKPSTSSYDTTTGLIKNGQPVTISAMFDTSLARVGTSNHFTVTSTVMPANAIGTGVVAMQGRLGLPKDANSSYAVPVKNVVQYVSIDGSSVSPRRAVVSTEKCAACHGAFLNNIGHGGTRNEIEVCVVCHNGNALTSATILSNGVATTTPVPVHFKVMIHSIHVPRSVPPTPPATHTLTRLNDYIIGDLTTTPPSGTNYQNEVKFPGNIANCTMCHVDETYRTDSGMLGTSFNAGASATDPTDDLKISPKASSCSSCHDNYQSHMVGFGGASFSFQQSLAMETPTAEHCQECHGASGGRDVKVWHNVK